VSTTDQITSAVWGSSIYQHWEVRDRSSFARQKHAQFLMEPAKVGDSAGFFSNYQQLASIFYEIIEENCIFCIATCPLLVPFGI
jgi:hypothetical protein